MQSPPKRSLVVYLWMLLALVLASCGEPEEPERSPLRRGKPNIDELQILKHDPRACDANADCPAGSHCDLEAQRCDWVCFSDSDCGDARRCDELGQCVQPERGAHLSTVSSQLATTASACQAVPIADRIAALDALELDPMVCFDDADCPCGAYCSNDATCRFDCYADSPLTPPFCQAGQQCSPEGRCIAADHSNDPEILADLQLAPSVVRADTALGAAVVPVEVRVRAKLATHVTRAREVTVRLGFDPALPTDWQPRVRCAAAGPFSPSCELGPGWTYPGGADPLLSAPRTVWVELPQWTQDASAALIARSEWADAPVSTRVLAQPVIEPPHDTGHFTGELSWPQPGGPPLTLAVEADVTASRLVLYEPSRVLLPEGHLVLSTREADTTWFAWLRSDDPARGALQPLLDVQSWTFDPAHERFTSTLRLDVGNGPAPTSLELRLDYASAATAPSCTAGCGAGTYCNAETATCLPGSYAPGGIIADGSYTPVSLLHSAQRAAWTSATTALRGYQYLFRGDDIIGMERAVCFASPSQSTAGWLGSTNANPSLDAQCTGSVNQQVFPFADATHAVLHDDAGNDTFSLLDACLADLQVTPSSPYTPANLLQTRPCVSLARFMLATTTPSPTTSNYPQIARARLQNQLTREWVMLHAMIARQSVREGEYDEVVTGESGPPPSERLGAAMDVMEKGWRQVVRQRRTDEAERTAAQQPDFRTLGRPLVHWTFNQTLDGLIDDVENDYDLRIANYPVASRNNKYLALGSTPVTCGTDKDVDLPSRHFSLVAWVAAANTPTTYNLIEKATATDAFRVRIYNSTTTTRRVTASYSSATLKGGGFSVVGEVQFDVPAEPGYYAFVAEGNKFRIYALRRNTNGTPIAQEITPLSTFGGGPQWGAPGRVTLGCQLSQGVVMLDEISLWERPLPIETVQTFALTYLTATGGGDPPKVSLPPRQLTMSATDEQAQGLSAHLVDAAAAHMELAADYVRSERSALFAECAQGAVGPVRTRVLGRAGRALRFVALVENDARDLLALAGTTAAPWRPRYDAASRLLAGKRAAAVQALAFATSCENPLGITDDDLPLFHGTEVGASARFFSSSRFLIDQARAQVTASSNELTAARSAWQEQRWSEFQHAVLDPTEKAGRLHKLENEYESALRRLCGAPSTDTLLAGFRGTLPSGALTSSNCFLKRELPACAGAELLPIKNVPAFCLRGQIGEQILTIQGAELDARNADNAHARALAQYDSEMEYCTRRADHHEETQAIREAHRAHMRKLRAARNSAGLLGSFGKAMVGMVIGGLTNNPALAISSWLDAVGVTLGASEQQAAADEADAEAAHQNVMAARAAAQDLMECFHRADNQKFAIDAAQDIIIRAYHDIKRAVLQLDNLHDEVETLVAQAIGDVELERSMVRVLPHHHYWLDDHIDGYRRHFRYAQRLTYLALRAFEYESQQSLGHERAVLASRKPGELDEIVLELEQRTAPMQGEQGFVVGEFAPVMSLRDEILRLGTGDAPPGFPTLDSVTALRTFLASDAAKIYSNGEYVGRGVRFSLRPPPWAQFSCAERIWRVTTALQVDGAPPTTARMVLWQENSFGSQRCRAAEHGELQIARIRPEHNLLVSDAGNFDGTSFVQPLRYTPMEVTGLGNRSVEELGALPEGAHSGFAGRGLYANYVLLFPSWQFDNPTFLSTVRDVLFRFDIVEVTNINGDPN
ncbi:MAG: hypothetical protein R3B48_02720 [Kofleriaceae bacterium]